MNAKEYLETIGAPVVASESTYAVPVPASCRGQVTVTVSEPDGLPAYARVSWSPDGKNWGWCGPVAVTDVDTIRRQISDAIAEMTPTGG